MNLNLVGTFSFTTVTVAANSTGFTSSMQFNRCNGYAAVKLTSSAGSVTVSQQCSPDGNLWFDPVDKDNNAIGKVATAMSANTAGRYVQYDPVLGTWIRFKIVELNVGATTVGLSLYIQEGP